MDLGQEFFVTANQVIEDFTYIVGSGVVQKFFEPFTKSCTYLYPNYFDDEGIYHIELEDGGFPLGFANFESETFTFEIDTTDTAYIDRYDFKIVATYADNQQYTVD